MTAEFRGVPFLRLAVSVGVLLIVVLVVDTGEVVARLSSMRSRWVILALVISVVQVGVSAWRWRFTASRLHLELPFVTALREYYLATFLNQVLPGGVMGDVSRAWRHVRMRRTDDAGTTVRAVILERASGQVVMTAVALVSTMSVLATWGAAPSLISGVVVVVVLGAGVLVWLVRRRRSRDTLIGRVSHDTHAALFAGPVFVIQLVSSLLVVATYLATYLVAARSVGVDTPTLILLPLVAPVLVSMLLPVTIAGWGVREGVAAALWSSVGLTAVDGVVVSVGYGVLVLLGSLPGALVLLRNSLREPGEAGV